MDASRALAPLLLLLLVLVHTARTASERLWRQDIPLVVPDEYFGPTGRTVRLKCRGPSPDATLMWTRAGGAPLPAGARSQYGALLLYSPQPSDSGVYVCRATRPGYPPITAEAHVNIVARPTPPSASVRVEPERQVVPQGSTAELRCVAAGAPQSAISWTRVRESLPDGAVLAGSVLRILNVAMRDRGVYVCTVTVPDRPPAQATSILEVEPREQPTVELYPGPQQTVVAGGSALMQCRVSGGVPLPTVSWSRSDGRPLSPSITRLDGGILRFEGVTQADEGQYICAAENPAGVATVTAELDVQEIPRISLTPPSPVSAVEGQRIRLECRASGDPPPLLTWSRCSPEENFYEPQAVTAEQEQTAVYEITRVTKSDEGSYSCRATNAAGSIEGRLLLTVEESNSYNTGETSYNPDSGDNSFIQKEGAARGFTMAFVFDSTSSMTDELKELKKAMQEIFDPMKPIRKDEIENYALVEFSDPNAKLLTITTDAKVYQQSLEKIRLKGGGDCPEMAMKGIKLALEKSLPNSYIFVFTDASAKDYKNRAEIDNLVQRKKSKVVFVLTGLCAGMNDPAYNVYTDVARVSNGRVYNLLKNEVSKVLQFLMEGTEKKDLIAKGEFSGREIVIIPVDSSLSEVTVFVGGEKPTIHFIGPTGIEESIVLFDAKRARSEKLLKPKPGNLIIEMRTKNEGVYDVTTKRTFNFLSGFSLKPTNHIYETVPRPLTGKETHLLIQLTNHTKHIQLLDVKLKDAKGIVLKTLKLNAVAGEKDTYNVQKFLPPQSIFFLEVSGKDSDNNTITRILDSGITPQLPVKPLLANGSSQESAIVGQQKELTCLIQEGNPFPTFSWYKDGEKLETEDLLDTNSRIFTNGSLIISYIAFADEGTYKCEATNDAGKASRSLNLNVYKAPDFIGNKYVKLKAKLGTTVQLICVAYGNPKPKVTWMKDKKLVMFSPSIVLDPVYDSILINSTTKENNGTYECVAVNTLGKQTRTIDLLIQDPPKISRPNSTDIFFKRGEETKLLCEVQAYPEAEIKWFKNGTPFATSSVYTSHNNSFLRLTTDSSPSGEYTCLATNDAGRDQVTFNVTEAVKPFLEDVVEHIYAKRGTNVTLSCITDAVPPADTYLWRKVPSTEFTEGDSTIFFENVNDSIAGIYHCYATYNVDEALKTFVVEWLNITVPPLIEAEIPEKHNIEKGSYFGIRCYARGIPEPTIRWLKNGIPLPLRHKNNLEIKNAAEEDAGLYTCVAENIEGLNEKRIQINIEVSPIMANGSLQESAIVGQQKELTCLIQKENPVPPISWYKDGEKLETKDLLDMEGNIFTNGSLIISYIKPTDEGTYKCQASNDSGKTIKSLNLIVNKAPVILGNKFAKLKAKLGATVRLTCEAYGKPKPKITWMKDKALIIFSPSIVLNPVDDSIFIISTKKENNGTYECVAVNTVGKQKKKIDLLIQGPPQISRPNSTDIFIIRGEERTLLCEVQTYSEAEIEWFKNGTPLATSFVHTSRNNSSLRLTTDSSPSGEYTCLATNDAGRDQVTFNVTEAVAPFFQDNMEYIHVKKRGTNVTLSCIADAVPPADAYLWQRIPSPDLMEGDSTITFENVNEAIAGIYRCYASNVVGTASKTFVVEVNEPPIIDADIPEKRNIEKGSYFELLCHAHGNPMPTIRWLKNGNPLSLDDPNMLQIKRATKEDAGLYSCVAENTEGLNEKRIQINV